jgi:hypothetical protein
MAAAVSGIGPADGDGPGRVVQPGRDGREPPPRIVAGRIGRRRQLIPPGFWNFRRCVVVRRRMIAAALGIDPAAVGAG